MADDEFFHERGGAELWGESWYFDFAGLDARLGGYVRVGWYPNLGTGWLWLALVGERLPGGRPVVVFDHDVSVGADGGEIVAEGRSGVCRLRCAEPFRAWSVSVETPQARLEADWTCSVPEYRYRETTRYEQSARVSGLITIGDDTVRGHTISVDAPGQRDHSWGVRDWWRIPWLWTAAHLDDGTALHVTRLLPSRPFRAYGYVLDAGLGFGEIGECSLTSVADEFGATPATTVLETPQLRLEAAVRHRTVVPLAGPGERTGALARSLSRFLAADGRTGAGWVEWNMPGVRAADLRAC